MNIRPSDLVIRLALLALHPRQFLDHRNILHQAPIFENRDDPARKNDHRGGILHLQQHSLFSLHPPESASKATSIRERERTIRHAMHAASKQRAILSCTSIVAGRTTAAEVGLLLHSHKHKPTKKSHRYTWYKYRQRSLEVSISVTFTARTFHPPFQARPGASKSNVPEYIVVTFPKEHPFHSCLLTPQFPFQNKKIRIIIWQVHAVPSEPSPSRKRLK